MLANLTLSVLLAAAPPEGRVPTRDGLSLSYKRYGTGPQAVLVPLGFILERDFASLSRPERSIVFYDQRGRGRSDAAPPARAHLSDEVADMEAVRAHFGFERVATIGYSYLGLMTVLYAMEHPDRVERLVQLGPVSRKFGTRYPAGEQMEDDPAPEALKQALARMDAEDVMSKEPRAYCEAQWAVLRFWLVGDPSKVERLGPGHCDLPNEWPINVGRHWREVRMLEMQALDIPLERIRSLEQPVLTIHGTKDRNAPYGGGREWARLLPGARLLTVQGAAHQSWADAPEVVLSAVDAFLTGKWPEAAVRVDP